MFPFFVDGFYTHPRWLAGFLPINSSIILVLVIAGGDSITP